MSARDDLSDSDEDDEVIHEEDDECEQGTGDHDIFEYQRRSGSITNNSDNKPLKKRINIIRDNLINEKEGKFSITMPS